MRFESSSSDTLAVAGMRLLAILPLAALGDLLRLLRVLDRVHRSPASGTSREAEDLDRRRGARLLELLAVLVRHRADLAEAGTGEDEVADAQRAVLNEDASRPGRGPLSSRASRTVPLAARLRVRLEVEDLRLESDHLEELVDALAGDARRRSRRSCRRPSPRAGGRARRARAGPARARRSACRSCSPPR